MKVLVWGALMLTIVSCKDSKRKKEEKNLFSVLSLLQSQIKKIDTGNYTITAIEKADGLSDTLNISREEFRNYAREFLSLPDISADDKRNNYDISKTYDSMLNNLVITYIANEEDEEITRETILWEPDSLGNSQVRTIYVNRVQEIKDSIIEKELTWHIDKRFQVIIKTQIPNQPEKISTLQVHWK